MNGNFHDWFHCFLADEVCTTADCTSSGEHCFLWFLFRKTGFSFSENRNIENVAKASLYLDHF